MRLTTSTLLIALALGAPAVLADQRPTPDQQTKIEAMLKQEGFTKWDEIEMDDGVWEVDDAVGADGRKYDLKLDPATFAITKRKPD